MQQYNEPVPMPQGEAAWTIVRVEDFSMFSGSALPQRGKRVWFRLADGDQSYVELPLSQFNKQSVTDAINQHAQDLYEVKAATGPTLPA